jgi:hypothetical protein
MSFESPVSVIYNEAGNEVALSSSAVINIATQPGLMVMGSSSNGTAQFFKILPGGELLVSGTFSFGGVSNVSVSNQPTVNQGSAGTVGQGWFIRITDGTQVLGTGSSAPVWITGSVTTNITTVATQSVYVGGWVPSVTASVKITDVATDVTMSTKEIGASSTTVSSTLAANGLVGYTLLSTNVNRRGATFYLEGNRVAFLKLGTGADVNTYYVRLTNNAYWEIPDFYTGPVSCTFLSGTAAATLYATEITTP